jgi:hypothetical protein
LIANTSSFAAGLEANTRNSRKVGSAPPASHSPLARRLAGRAERHRDAGVSVVSLGVTFDMRPPEPGFPMLAASRHWIERHAADYVLAQTARDIEAAKRDAKLGVMFARIMLK